MKTKPQKWTHYHTHRLFHLSMLAISGLIILGLAIGLIFIVANTHAGGQVQSSAPPDNISATVSGVQGGPVGPPPTGGTFGTGGPPSNICCSPLPPANTPPQNVPPTQNPPPTNLISAPTVSIVPDKNYGSQNNGTFTFVVGRPGFNGYTNIPNANIYLEINNKPLIRGTAKATADGLWQWKSYVSLAPGTYSISVRAQDPAAPQVYAVARLAFAISPNIPPGKPGKPVNPPPVIAPPQSANGFNIFIQIPPRFKIIQPGDEFIANVTLVDFGSSKPVDLELEYIIEDDNGTVVTDFFDLVHITDNLSLAKTFFTRPELAEGHYILILKVPTADLVAAAYDDFNVKGRANIPLSLYSKADFTVVYQAFIVLIFLFLIILYLEYNRVVILSKIIAHIDEVSLKPEVQPRPPT